jgi:hypothetical protein
MSAQRPKQRKIGSRSCDACKIRKVRCTELPPCERCVAIGIDCTFNKTQSTRGPRTLRAKTLQQIQEAQQNGGAYDNGRVYATTTPTAQMPLPTGTASSTTPGANSGGTPETTTTHSEPDTSMPHGGIYGPPPGHATPSHGITVESLVLRLCIYRLRLFPVWPIIAVEEIIASLQRDAHDLETYALALSVGAATMAQLKLDRFRDAGINDVVTASVLERECQRVRDRLPAAAGLHALRTSFFLHIYHENQQPGGTRSLLYLREAVTLAQVMGLHRPSTYPSLDASEGRVRRRILWLLFVTERGVAMLHRLPVVLRSAERLPPLDGDGPDEEAHILPAFKRLVNLFWTFDRSGAFDIIQDAADDSGSGGRGVASPELLAALQRRLQEEDPLDGDDGGSDVQRADIAATRQWMKVLVWRATLGGWRANSSANSASSTPAFSPIQIAHEFLELISRLPSAALEAHGPALEYKVYEIASAVADAIPAQLDTAVQSLNVRPADILMRLQRILATSRGGNNSLLGLLAARIAQVEAPQFAVVADYAFPPGPARRVEEVVDDEWQQEGQQRTPSSPWQSLVAAAELEQQSMGGQQQHMAMRQQANPSSRSGTITPNSAGWYSQPLGLLNHIYGLDPPLSQSPPLEALPGELSEMLANDNWLLGLNMGTPSPRMA